ncbi:MAG: hypothetical protein ACFFC7_01585 [Candidatus Hermodarchaeota archaeon]
MIQILKDRKTSKQVIATGFLIILIMILSLENTSMLLSSEWETNEELKEPIFGLKPLDIPNQIDKCRVPAMEITKVGNILSCDSWDVAIVGSIAYVAGWSWWARNS